MKRFILYLAWAWMILVGGLLITPGGVFCIVCGASLNVPGYIGRPAATLLGIVSIAFGIAGFVIQRAATMASRQ